MHLNTKETQLVIDWAEISFLGSHHKTQHDFAFCALWVGLDGENFESYFLC